MFVAVSGEAHDGHDFIADAVRHGASAVVCERVPQPLPGCMVVQVGDSRLALSALAAAFNRRPADRLCSIAVTGTDGKTTTTELCRAILTEAGHPTGSLGTVHYSLGSRTVDSDQTTPHPLVLHALLREMLDRGLTHVCMEVSSHSLVQRRTAHVPFKAAVLTNVTEDHLDYHGSAEEYARAKQRLFESLGPSATAVLNAASPVCERYREACHARTLTYGLKVAADVRAIGHCQSASGTDIAVQTPSGTVQLHSPLIGDYNAENIMAALTLALALDVPMEAVRSAVAKFTGVAGRLERIEVPDGEALPTVFVDYAHTPNGLRSVLGALRPLTKGRLICVFGCGGDRERQKRPLMGAISGELADLTVLTSDNSRSESTDEIIAQIVAGMSRDSSECLTVPDRREAIEAALARADSSLDVVAICGRGCEREQVLMQCRTPFDDRVVAREILLGLSRRRRRSA